MEKKAIFGKLPELPEGGKNVLASPTSMSLVFQSPALSEQIQIAGILRALKMCSEDWSFASCAGLNDLLKVMFPGSISNGFKMSSTKASLFGS